MSDTQDEPIWDKAALERRVRGKQDRMAKLISLYLNDMPERMDSLTQEIQQEHMETAYLLAHTIKGVSGNLGVARLQSIAGKLEAAAKQEQTAEAKELLPLVTQEYESSLAPLRAFVAQV